MPNPLEHVTLLGKPGDFYATRQKDGIAVQRVIACEPKSDVIHLQLYAQRFSKVPTLDEVRSLPRVMTSEDREKERIATDHTPIQLSGYLAEGPILIGNIPLTENDLEGFRCYQAALTADNQ